MNEENSRIPRLKANEGSVLIMADCPALDEGIRWWLQQQGQTRIETSASLESAQRSLNAPRTGDERIMLVFWKARLGMKRPHDLIRKAARRGLKNCCLVAVSFYEPDRAAQVEVTGGLSWPPEKLDELIERLFRSPDRDGTYNHHEALVWADDRDTSIVSGVA